MSYLNQDQQSHFNKLSAASTAEKCNCGWQWRGHCYGTCFGDEVKGGARRPKQASQQNNEQFMEEFRLCMYPFKTLQEHAEHLAQLKARGLIESSSEFVEGSGRIDGTDGGVPVTIKVTFEDIESSASPVGHVDEKMLQEDGAKS